MREKQSGGLEIHQLVVPLSLFDLSIPSLQVKPGQICCLMGKSGSGKTTLLNAIAGFAELRQGEIQLNGRCISHLPPEQRRIAFVFQKGALFPHLSVLENVEFALKLQGIERKERSARAIEWLRKLDVEPLMHRSVQEVSGGEAQRIQLARALIAGFPVLLLDEPFSALDTGLRKQHRELVKHLVRETGVIAVIVTHDLKDAEILGDQIHMIEEGKIIASGNFEELRRGEYFALE